MVLNQPGPQSTATSDLHPPTVCVCVSESSHCAQNKTNTARSPGTPPRKQTPLRRLQIRVFQMNNKEREMTNSRSDERFNVCEPESKNGFRLLNVTLLLEPIKQGQSDSLPSRSDAVNLLCAEPGSLYINGCTSTDCE